MVQYGNGTGYGGGRLYQQALPAKGADIPYERCFAALWKDTGCVGAGGCPGGYAGRHCDEKRTGDHLSALEYRLLLIFINNKGIVLTRNKLLEEIWDAAGEYVNDNTLTVYIKRLRQKIEDDPQEPVLIRTVRGMGYRA